MDYDRSKMVCCWKKCKTIGCSNQSGEFFFCSEHTRMAHNYPGTWRITDKNIDEKKRQVG